MPRMDCRLQALAEGNDGTIWIGSRSDGLYYFKDGRATQLVTGSVSPKNSVGGLLINREGTVWFGTVGEGLHRLSRRALQFWGKAEGLAEPYVSSVAEDQTGKLWVGTQSDGLWQFAGQRFRKVEDPGMGPNRPIVYSVTSAEDASVWGAGEQYLLRFALGQTTRTYLQPPIRGEAIRALCADGTNLWVGTYYSTLIKVEGTNLSVMATNGSFGGGITSLVREGPETLWIGTSDGLYRWARGAVKSWTWMGRSGSGRWVADWRG
jgi:ligand-binding sensor domain-containing protein